MKPGMYIQRAPVFLVQWGNEKWSCINVARYRYFINPNARNDLDLLRHEFGHWIVAIAEGNKAFYQIDVPYSLISAAISKSNYEHPR